jgi:hypothetical protein
MDHVKHPLDWWAHGGYLAVMRKLGYSEAVARRKVRLKLRDYYLKTGDPVWKPLGSSGYAALRKAILDGRLLPNDLT